MGYNRQKKIMKKLLIICCALFTFTIAANAVCTASAFSAVYESISITYQGTNNPIVVDGTSIWFQKNPYANSKMCAPDMNWATCYEYCFTYKGKTYFFNPC